MNQQKPRFAWTDSNVRLMVAFAVAVSILSRTPLANAATPTTKPTVNVAVMYPELLKLYRFLATADNTYDDHRDQAMKEIADTCQLMGKKATLISTTGPKQHIEDLQLRSVQMELLQIGRTVNTTDANAPIIAHLNSAIGELAAAVSYSKSTSASAASAGSANDSTSAPSNSAKGRGAAAAGRGTANAAKGLPQSAKAAHTIIVDNPIGTDTVVVGSLEDIYETLSVANHDYKGHRIKAMKAIARVVKVLGGNISGDGRGHEQQIVSDQQLRYAQFLLHQVDQSFTTNDPKAVLADLTLADTEMTTALSIK